MICVCSVLFISFIGWFVLFFVFWCNVLVMLVSCWFSVVSGDFVGGWFLVRLVCVVVSLFSVSCVVRCGVSCVDIEFIVSSRYVVSIGVLCFWRWVVCLFI